MTYTLDQITYIEQYAEQQPTFSYGLDELLNLLNIESLESLELDEGMMRHINKIKNKRIRFLKSQLTSPGLKAWQVSAIIKELEWDRLDNHKDIDTSESISISLISNIEGRGDE